MERIRDYLVKKRLGMFLTNIFTFPVTTKSSFDQITVRHWMQSLMNDPVIENVSCYIAENLPLVMSMSNVPMSYQRHHLFNLRTKNPTHWAQKVNRMSQ